MATFTVITLANPPFSETQLRVVRPTLVGVPILVDISPPTLAAPLFPAPGATGVPVDTLVRIRVGDDGKGLDVDNSEIRIKQGSAPETVAFDGTAIQPPYDGPFSGFVFIDGVWTFDLDITSGEYPAGTIIFVTATFPDKAQGEPENTVVVT